MLHDSCWSLDGHDDCRIGFGSGSSFKRIGPNEVESGSPWNKTRSLTLSYLSLTALREPNGAPTMAAATGFLPAFYVGDRASLITLPGRATGALGVAAEARSDEAEKKKKQRGITKPRPVSPQLQAVVGEVEIPRTQALKKIWAYIKENNLQVALFSLPVLICS